MILCKHVDVLRDEQLIPYLISLSEHIFSVFVCYLLVIKLLVPIKVNKWLTILLSNITRAEYIVYFLLECYTRLSLTP